MSGEYWITDIEAHNIGIFPEDIPKTKRKPVYYMYPNSKYASLLLTVPKDPEAYVTIGKPKIYNGVRKDGTSFKSSKHSVALIIDLNNEYNKRFYNSLKTLEQKISEIVKNPNCRLTSKDAEGKYVLYCSLIESPDRIYSSFYTETDYVDPNGVQKFSGRPALSFSVNIETGKIYVQLNSAFIYMLVNDKPLAHLE